MAAAYPRWVGDIGGTNARFGWQESAGAPLSDIKGYATEDYPTLQDAMRKYLSDHRRTAAPSCAIGIATAIDGDLVAFTNNPWAFSIQQVKQRFGFDRFLVLNDFTTLALSLPALKPSELRQVGAGQAVVGEPVGLLGAGTGLGVSGLFTSADGRVRIPIDGEGGHVTLGGVDAREDAVIALLRKRFGHPSAERALSGPGLVNLYEALSVVDAFPARSLTPAEISQHALDGSDPYCVATVELFFSLLGTVAGNLALSLGARGGVYIGGGIVPKLGDWIDRSAFRERFAAKGRFRAYLEAIPTWVVTADNPALTGALRALDEA
jgi:glucokinase